MEPEFDAPEDMNFQDENTNQEEDLYGMGLHGKTTQRKKYRSFMDQDIGLGMESGYTPEDDAMLRDLEDNVPSQYNNGDLEEEMRLLQEELDQDRFDSQSQHALQSRNNQPARVQEPSPTNGQQQKESTFTNQVSQIKASDDEAAVPSGTESDEMVAKNTLEPQHELDQAIAHTVTTVNDRTNETEKNMADTLHQKTHENNEWNAGNFDDEELQVEYEKSEVQTEPWLRDRPQWGVDNSICVTLSDGNRLYAKFQTDKFDTEQEENLEPVPKEMLEESVSTMLDRIKEKQTKENIARRARQVDAANKHRPKSSGSMWVDKYAPSSFLHLLSDETINRSVLKWIKRWDKRVFKSKHAVPKDKSKMHNLFDFSANKASASKEKEQTATNRSGTKQSDPANPNEQKDRTMANLPYGWNPNSRVLLFSGPPGTGKTTLAHIAAKTAGYQPLELNASDDRSSKKIHDRLVDAMQMHTVFGSKKPVLLVLDEVDGIEGGAQGGIQELLKMIRATPTPGSDVETSSNSNDDPSKKRRGPKKPQHLTRPLICICNDLYSPALRELRQIAQVVQFQSPPSESLVQRLKQICRREGMNVTDDGLYALVNQTDSDIRSCLHTLQFMT